MTTSNLTGTQIKKLALRKHYNICYVVMEGGKFICLTHNEYTDNSVHCSQHHNPKKR